MNRWELLPTTNRPLPAWFGFRRVSGQEDWITPLWSSPKASARLAIQATDLNTHHSVLRCLHTSACMDSDVSCWEMVASGQELRKYGNVGRKGEFKKSEHCMTSRYTVTPADIPLFEKLHQKRKIENWKATRRGKFFFHIWLYPNHHHLYTSFQQQKKFTKPFMDRIK